MKQLDYYGVMNKKVEELYSRKIVLILDDLKLPPNIAGMFRLADGFQVEQVLLLCNEEFVLSKKFRAISRVDGENISFKVCEEHEIVDWLKSNRASHEIVAIEYTDQSHSMPNLPIDKNLVLIMGSERFGVRPTFLQHCSSSFHIPMQGELSSLNVTTAAAIALYEARRQEMIKEK